MPSDKQRRQAIEQALKEGSAPRGSGARQNSATGMASKRLGMPRSTLNDWSRRQEQLAAEGRPNEAVNWDLFKPQPDQPLVDSREDDLKRLRKENVKLRKETKAASEIEKAAFGLTSKPVKPPKWTLKPSRKAGSPGVPILVTSDFQWGEVIDEAEMDGINSFNPEIAADRYKRLIKTTLDICNNHMGKASYDGVVYLRGGDSVSGEIHAELRETNELHSLEATHDLVEKESAGIAALAEAFGNVRVISTPGNHGRTTVKPHSKKYAAHNYDYWAAKNLERHFQGDNRVTFEAPISGDALFKIYDFQFLLTHGDRIGSRGGQGMVGPAATIARGMKKVRDYYIERQIILYKIICGHFHTALELEHGFANGCLPGASEYSRDGRFIPKPPSQWLLFCHPKWGITARWNILLEDPLK